MKMRAWLALCLGALAFVQGCCHHRCCHRRPLFNGGRLHKYRHAEAAPTTCCHGGEAAMPHVATPHFAPSPMPLPPGPPPLAK